MSGRQHGNDRPDGLGAVHPGPDSEHSGADAEHPGAGSEHSGAAHRGRGRPPRAVLSRDSIGEEALRIAGAEGFAALSMHRLARELGVSARALYNHVRDRQEVVDMVAGLMMEELPVPTFDAEDWREALRNAYHEARAVYRRFPRALLISLDETVTAGEVPLRRFELSETMLDFFVGIGLTLPQSLVLRGAFLGDVFAQALLIDYRYDTADETARRAMSQPVPRAWLDARPDADVPMSRAAAELPPLTSDEQFDALVDLRIGAIEHLLSARD